MLANLKAVAQWTAQHAGARRGTDQGEWPQLQIERPRIDAFAEHNIDAKIFQGYVLVEMKLTDETWYIVRNTPGVTGFVGADTTPTPVSEHEMRKIKKRMGVEEPKHQIDLSEGEVVSITDGPFKGFDGSVAEIDAVKGKIKVMVSMFGRDTSVELDALQVKKV